MSNSTKTFWDTRASLCSKVADSQWNASSLRKTLVMITGGGKIR